MYFRCDERTGSGGLPPVERRFAFGIGVTSICRSSSNSFCAVVWMNDLPSSLKVLRNRDTFEESMLLHLVHSKSRTYLVAYHGVSERGVALRIQVVGPYEDLPLRGWHRKRTHPGHYIANYFPRLEEADKPLMLGVESAIPEDFGVVEAESAIQLFDLDVHGRISREQLVLEGPVFILRTNFVNFVDDRSDSRILVHEYCSNEMLVL